MGKHKIKHLSMLSIKSNIYHAISSKLREDEMCMLPCRDIAFVHPYCKCMDI